jgi:flagellar hook assembly protein FlgD
VTGQTIDLRNQSSYQFNSGEKAGTRAFSLTARQSTLVGRPVISNIVVNPSRSVPGRSTPIYDIGYTVSSDVSVQLSIMSYGGRQIAQIGATRAVASGDNHVTWNGSDDAGRALPAGNYVLQIQAKTQDGEVTRVIRPLIITGR